MNECVTLVINSTVASVALHIFSIVLICIDVYLLQKQSIVGKLIEEQMSQYSQKLVTVVLR
jgi:hypothetical protein